MTKDVAPLCTVSNAEFFEDLAATYAFLNNPNHVVVASNIIRERYEDEAIWLNEEVPLERISRSTLIPDTTPVSHRRWLKANSILHDIPFDIIKSKQYSLKSSLERYSNLLHACGSTSIDSPEANLTTEDIENHGNNIVRSLKSMRPLSNSLCDFSIKIEGKSFHVHRMLLVAVSPWFSTLAENKWREWETGVLDFDLGQNDGVAAGQRSTVLEARGGIESTEMTERLYGTSESVAAFVDWVYNGYLDLNDKDIKDDLEKVKARLDLYFDVLRLADVWEIPLLRVHVENLVLKSKGSFIRPENVQGVYERANDCDAKEIVKYCQEYKQRNESVVKNIENT